MTGGTKDIRFQVMIDRALNAKVYRVAKLAGYSLPETRRKVIQFGTAGMLVVMNEYEPGQPSNFQIECAIDQMTPETQRRFMEGLMRRTSQLDYVRLNMRGNENLMQARGEKIHTRQDNFSGNGMPSSREALPSVYDPWTVKDLDQQNLGDLRLLPQALDHKKLQVETYISSLSEIVRKGHFDNNKLHPIQRGIRLAPDYSFLNRLTD